MKALKRIIAAVMIAVVMTTCIVASASAGSILDFFGSVGSTIGQAFKTAGQAIAGGVTYIFDEDTGNELFDDMKESASKTAKNAVSIKDNAVRVAEDAVDTVKGIGMMVGGAISTAACAIGESVEYICTGGESDFSYTETCSDLFVDGYNTADNDFLLDMALVGGAAVGIPTYAAAGARVAKAGLEYATGAKDADDLKKELITSGMTVLTAGTGAVVSDMTGSAVTGMLTGTGVSTGAKIGIDIATNTDENRTIADIVMEDIGTSAVKMGVGYGIKCATGSGTAAADENAADDLGWMENFEAGDSMVDSTVNVLDVAFDNGYEALET